MSDREKYFKMCQEKGIDPYNKEGQLPNFFDEASPKEESK